MARLSTEQVGIEAGGIFGDLSSGFVYLEGRNFLDDDGEKGPPFGLGVGVALRESGEEDAVIGGISANYDIGFIGRWHTTLSIRTLVATGSPHGVVHLLIGIWRGAQRAPEMGQAGAP